MPRRALFPRVVIAGAYLIWSVAAARTHAVQGAAGEQAPPSIPPAVTQSLGDAVTPPGIPMTGSLVTQPRQPAVDLVTEAVEPAVGGLGMKGTIRVHVRGLPKPAMPEDAARDAAYYQQWVLYLDGRPIHGLYPSTVDVYTGNFYFAMRRDERSAEAWKALFKQFSWYQLTGPVSLGVGPELGGTPVRALEKQANKFVLVIIPPRRLVFLAVAYVVLGVVIYHLARHSNMLRAPRAQDEPSGHRGHRRPYSLGRTQMAAWFMVVLAAYLWLGLITDNWLGSLNASTLGLMGIAAGTALGAQAIDRGKEGRATAAPHEVESLSGEARTLEEALKAAPSAEAAGALAQRLGVVRTRLATAEVAKAGRTAHTRSLSFWWDLVSDEGGVALHRVQVVVWTAVLCGVFIASVWRDLAMPTFEPTFLTLMGISSGTYLGFKVPERG